MNINNSQLFSVGVISLWASIPIPANADEHLAAVKTLFLYASPEERLEIANMVDAQIASRIDSAKVHLAALSDADLFNLGESLKDAPGMNLVHVAQVSNMGSGAASPVASTETDSVQSDDDSKHAVVDPVKVGPDLGHGWRLRWDALKPSGRIFFDTGSDDPGEVDLFNDGTATVQLQFLSLGAEYIAVDSLHFYPNVSAGISSAQTGTNESGLVFALSAGLTVEFPFTDTIRAGLESGYMTGFTADESFDDANDGAFYVGLTFGKGLFSNLDENKKETSKTPTTK